MPIHSLGDQKPLLCDSWQCYIDHFCDSHDARAFKTYLTIRTFAPRHPLSGRSSTASQEKTKTREVGLQPPSQRAFLRAPHDALAPAAQSRDSPAVMLQRCRRGLARFFSQRAMVGKCGMLGRRSDWCPEGHENT